MLWSTEQCCGSWVQGDGAIQLFALCQTSPRARDLRGLTPCKPPQATFQTLMDTCEVSARGRLEV